MKVTYYNTNHFSNNENSLKESLSSFCKRIETEALPFSTLDFVDELIISIEKVNSEIQNFKHLLLLGVGGSALGPQTLQQSFAPQDRHPIFSKTENSADNTCSKTKDRKQLWIADNVDTHFFSECLTSLPPEDTLVLVISKSGSTLETISQYFICKEWLENKLPESWQEHFCVITDQNSGFLRSEVQTHQYKSLNVPKELGGRFSIFSAVGMLPSAFLGINYKDFLQGAKDARDSFFSDTETYLSKFEQEERNPLRPALPHVFKMAYFAFEAMENDFSQLIFFNYLPKWSALGTWFRQLWSESLGKKGKGSTPIPALGATDQHSILQLFLDGAKDKACIFINQHNSAEKDALYCQNNSNCLIPKNIPEEWQWIAGKSLSQILEAESLATRASLIKYEIPLLSLEPMQNTEYDLGKLMWNFSMMTILTAYFLDINPLDQPAVEEGKILTKTYLSTNK